MSTLGNLLLVIALIVSVMTGVLYFMSWNKKKDTTVLNKYAEFGIKTIFAILTLSELLLLIALIADNYTLQYVYQYTSNETALIYKITALWAGNAGALLIWAWICSLLSFLLIKIKRPGLKELVPQAMPVMLLVNILFIVLIFSANPFTPAAMPYTNGHGLNPLLENIAMILHPPLLLIGYVLLAVPFALAVSSLIQKRTDSLWITEARPWALLGWLFLGAGNILGMWWAYVELGWGGYWAWDPVENSGLMPWLLATAFLHSSLMEKRRNSFKIWNYVLIIFAFNMTMFGAFLSRSDILESVHSFGSTAMGPAFLVFLIISLGVSLTLLIRNKKLYKTTSEEDSFFSSDTSFLLVNVLLSLSTFATWVGTMYPFFSEILTGRRIEQTKAFFQTVNVPLFVILAVIAGIGIMFDFKKKSAKEMKLDILVPVLVAIAASVVMAFIGWTKWYVIVSGFAFFYMIASTIWKWIMDIKTAASGTNKTVFEALGNLFKTNRPRYGSYLAHIGIAIMALGIMASTVFPESESNTLAIGESLTVSNYEITFDGMQLSMDQIPEGGGMGNKINYYAFYDVTKNGKYVGRITPHRSFYRSQAQWVSEIGIRSTLIDDIYISLDDWDDNTSTISVKVNPGVLWIWIGGIILVLGGLVAFSKER
jgi:cytochrome c-type biogenesis protein CcmF